MKHKSSAHKTPQTTTHSASPDASAGSNGIAVAPPAYGIDIVDRQSAEAAREPGAEQLAPAGPIQMQAGASATGSDAGARPENRTGLPARLKAGIESLSGMAMDDVRVHYNSAKPTRIQALAYTQGANIYVGLGQERHVPHEAWHVVQQKQGRVRPTIQAKGVAINNDSGLEKEADVMGATANRAPGRNLPRGNYESLLEVTVDPNTAPLQRAIGYEFETGYPLLNPELEGFYTAKNETVIEADNKKWKAVGDSGAMEFVTVPISETLEGSKEAVAVVDQMAHFALHVESFINKGTAYLKSNVLKQLGMRATAKNINYTQFDTALDVAGADRTYTSIKHIAGGQSVKAAQPDLLLADAKTHRMEGAPQATAGIRTQMIPELFETIANDPTLGRHQTDNDELELSAQLARRACEAYFIDPSSKFAGFLALVISYLRIPVEYAKVDKGPAEYPKDMPVLSRTNMGQLAMEVIETRAQNDFFNNLAEVLVWSGLSGGLDQRMFPFGYKMADGVEPGPTRREWLQGLNEGKDWFAGHTNPGQSSMGSMELGRQSTDIFQRQPKDRTILEFRRIQGPVHAGDWPKLAQKIFYEVMKINKTT
jgi:hypothetical protein